MAVENKKFNYGFLTGLDLIKDNAALYKFIQSQKIICSGCNSLYSIKYEDYNISIKCKCVISRIYPPRDDRAGAYLVAKKYLSKRGIKNV